MLFTYQQVQKQVGTGSVTWSGTQALSVPPPCRPPHMNLSLLGLSPRDYRMAAVAPIPKTGRPGKEGDEGALFSDTRVFRQQQNFFPRNSQQTFRYFISQTGFISETTEKTKEAASIRESL